MFGLKKMYLSFFLGLFFWVSLGQNLGETPQNLSQNRGQHWVDSVRFCNSKNWKIVANKDGILVRELRSTFKDSSTYLFHNPAHVYVMEIDPMRYNFGFAQSSNKHTVSELQNIYNGVASVNGGFFRVDEAAGDRAISNDFLKIDGRILSPFPTTGWGSGAVGFDSIGKPFFTLWDKSMDSDTISGWSSRFASVMVAGPMLLLDGVLVPNSDPACHPRTAIGTRPDGAVVLIVIDGRQKNAFGMSFSEMSILGRFLGLDNLLNLDGGGSSTMIYGNRLVNFPSDGLGILPLQRKVANALLVLPKNN